MANKHLVEQYDKMYESSTGTSLKRIVPYVRFPGDRFEACVKHIMDRFSGGAVMEIGGGDGTIARGLLNAGLDCRRYVLTDLSDVRVQRAAESINDPRIDTRALDVESDVFAVTEDEQFDCIIMVALIEHLIDPIQAMINIRARLKPGGFVYIGTPNVAKFTRRARLMLGQFPSTGGSQEGLRKTSGDVVNILDGGHLHYFTFRALSRMLREYCGYTQCENLPYWDGMHVLSRPVENALATAWPEMFSEITMIARE